MIESLDLEQLWRSAPRWAQVWLAGTIAWLAFEVVLVLRRAGQKAQKSVAKAGTRDALGGRQGELGALGLLATLAKQVNEQAKAAQARAQAQATGMDVRSGWRPQSGAQSAHAGSHSHVGRFRPWLTAWNRLHGDFGYYIHHLRTLEGAGETLADFSASHFLKLCQQATLRLKEAERRCASSHDIIDEADIAQVISESQRAYTQARQAVAVLQDSHAQLLQGNSLQLGAWIRILEELYADGSFPEGFGESSDLVSAWDDEYERPDVDTRKRSRKRGASSGADTRKAVFRDALILAEVLPKSGGVQRGGRGRI